MAKGVKVVTEWRGIPILTDGKNYFVPDFLGDYYMFACEDDAINYIETGEI